MADENTTQPVEISEIEAKDIATWIIDAGAEWEIQLSNQSGSINEDKLVQKVSLKKSISSNKFYQANSKKVATIKGELY